MKRYIAEGLSKYINKYHSVWHMPGHKRKPAYPDYIYDEDNNRDIQRIDDIIDRLHSFDVTEVFGLDDLHNPHEMIKASNEELAKVYKTFASYYLINGSTCGIMAAISACVLPGEKIIVAENCHKSVHNIIELLGLSAVFAKPEKVVVSNLDFKGKETCEYKISGGILPESLKQLCEENKDAKAVVITSPTYEGIISDIKEIGKITHDYGMKLIVDEAHGAHLPFMYKEGEDMSAVYRGADVIIQSLHKTLPSMTQTAVLHVMDESINREVKRKLSIFMSSSPSYVMLYDMERAVDTADRTDYSDYKIILSDFRTGCAGFKNLTLSDRKNIKTDTKYYYDPTRLVFFTDNRISGAGLERLLFEEFDIVCEMSGPDYIVLISTFFDKKEDFDYLYESLKKLDDNFEDYLKKIREIEKKSGQVYAFDTNFSDNDYIEEMIKELKGLEGTAAKDNIYVYPPGIYILKKGELFTKEKTKELITYVSMGKQLRGDFN